MAGATVNEGARSAAHAHRPRLSALAPFSRRGAARARGTSGAHRRPIACLLVKPGIVGWFSSVAWRWIAAADDPNNDDFVGYLFAVPALIVVAFRVKGLFALQKGGVNGRIEGSAAALRPPF